MNDYLIPVGTNAGSNKDIKEGEVWFIEINNLINRYFIHKMHNFIVELRPLPIRLPANIIYKEIKSIRFIEKSESQQDI